MNSENMQKSRQSKLQREATHSSFIPHSTFSVRLVPPAVTAGQRATLGGPGNGDRLGSETRVLGLAELALVISSPEAAEPAAAQCRTSNLTTRHFPIN